MPSDPKISVLMSVYNADKYVGEAIQSILNQTHQNIELLVADDGSTDSTRRVIDSFVEDDRVVILHNNSNQGKVLTINQLLAKASGEFITVHDGDDVSKPERFEIQVEEFFRVPELVMCGTWFNYVDVKGNILSECQSITDYHTILTEIRKGSVFHGPTTMFRKNVLNELSEFFRPYFETYHEDADLNYRLSELGPCYNVPANVYDYRVVPGSLSKKFEPRKLVLYDLVYHLAQQRDETGKDDLQRGDVEKVDAHVASLLVKYDQNPSQFHHDAASRLMQFGLISDAIRQAWQAIKAEPLKLINYRLLQYCLRKRIGL